MFNARSNTEKAEQHPGKPHGLQKKGGPLYANPPLNNISK